MNETAIWTIILVAVFGILMTTRHTRLEEETARSELVRSAPVGRYAGAAAGLLAVLVSQLIVASTVALTVIGFGYGPVGALAFGVALVAAGSAFAATTLVAAQIAASSRAASGLGLMMLGIAFFVRAYGDVTAPWLSWLSPIHWAQAMRAYAGERWLVVVPSRGANRGAAACRRFICRAPRLSVADWSRRDQGGPRQTQATIPCLPWRPGCAADPSSAGRSASSPERSSLASWPTRSRQWLRRILQ